MKRSQKTPDFRQGELFATHDVTWGMLTEDQQMHTIELLSQLLLALSATQPLSHEQSHDQTLIEQTDTPENKP